jgi:hypothetical protein
MTVLQMKNVNPMSTEFHNDGTSKHGSVSKRQRVYEDDENSHTGPATTVPSANATANAVPDDALAAASTFEALEQIHSAALAAQVAAAPAVAAVSSDTSAADAAFWKEEYKKLSELRQTVAEQQMKMMKEWSDDRIAAMQGQIDFLQEQVGVPAAEICKKEDLNMVSKKLKRKEEIVAFYSSLTSTTVTHSKDRKGMECLTTNPESGKAVGYTVTRADGNVTFKPTANTKFLPVELRNKVEFEESQLPFLMKEIYNTDMFMQEE